MAEAPFYVCDICGANVEKHHRLLVPTGYITTENVKFVRRETDLCINCQNKLLRAIANEHPDGYKRFNQQLAKMHDEAVRCHV